VSAFGDGERRDFTARVRTAERESARTGRPQLAWLSRPVDAPEPFSLFAAAAGAERFFWEEPGGALVLVSAGAVETLDGVGEARLHEVMRAASAPFGARDGAPSGAVAGPLLVGGFGFSPEPAGAVWRGFPPARFVVPAQLVVRRGAEAVHTATVRVEAGADPEDLVRRAERSWMRLLEARRAASAGAAPPLQDPDVELPAVFRASADQPFARYRAIVHEALRAIRAGSFEKVVVARSCTLARPHGFDAVRVLETLHAAHPACFRFAVGRPDATFLAATPERLLRLEGRRVRTSALAGSAPRGRTPEEDARLGARLRESKKEQEEHAVVVRALRAALEPRCVTLSAPEAPVLLRLDGIQHLHTPIEGVLRDEVPASLLDLAARLHPSPAIAGAPRAAALAWLRAHEGLDRGWYAGAVGWMTPAGEGELAVALRTALLRGDDAILHAGAGIVEGSTPEAELGETRLKLRGGLAALLEI
jgi:isochorismate synthase